MYKINISDKNQLYKSEKNKQINMFLSIFLLWSKHNNQKDLVLAVSKNEELLEHLLAQAVNEPAFRPVFLEALLEGSIYCVGYTNEAESSTVVQRQLSVGSQIFIKSWDDDEFQRIIPFFTSLEKMQLAIEHSESFLYLPTTTFMQLTTGAKLVLNPESDAVKVFYPTEVQALLNGHFSTEPEEYIYEEDVEILLSEPDPYPTYMVQQLQKYLQQRPEIQAAYLAEMFDAQRDTQPVLVIGLVFKTELEGQALQHLHQHIGQVAFDSLAEDARALDLVHLHEEDDLCDGLEQYLLEQTQPFYRAIDPHENGFFATLFS